MKKHQILILLIIVGLSACSPSSNNVSNINNGITKEVNEEANDEQALQNNGNNDQAKTPAETPLPIPTSGLNCYQEGEHPIGLSIANQFEQITNYEQVMTWFCNGALFEDILNALTTEELAGVAADDLLQLVAEGKTWNEIWLELGITEQ